MGASILEVRDLRYSLKGKDIFDGLSLTLEGGRIYALLGKPGCGKTALLRILAGLWPMQEGTAGTTRRMRTESVLRSLRLC